MKKVLLSAALFVATTVSFAQVGIGTTMPKANTSLHIDGGKDNTSATPTTAEAANDVVVTNDGNFGVRGATPTAGTLIRVNANYTGLNTSTNWPLWIDSFGGAFGGFYQPATSGTSEGIWLYLRDNAGYKVKIAPKGDTYFNGGNVGIGIALPTSKLHIADGDILATSTSTPQVKIAYDNGVTADYREAYMRYDKTNDKTQIRSLQPGVGYKPLELQGSKIILNGSAGINIGNAAIANDYTLPTARGMDGQVLKTDGSGNVTWQLDAAYSAQYNNNVVNAGSYVANTWIDIVPTNALAVGSYVFEVWANVGTSSPYGDKHIAATGSFTVSNDWLGQSTQEITLLTSSRQGLLTPSNGAIVMRILDAATNSQTGLQVKYTDDLVLPNVTFYIRARKLF